MKTESPITCPKTIATINAMFEEKRRAQQEKDLRCGIRVTVVCFGVVLAALIIKGYFA